jgi:quercetin dioxygenase-like cupin family protein
MDLPKSGARGFFEILMPGVFLLLNLLGTFGLLMATLADEPQQKAAREFLIDPAYALALILSLGYLLGVVLRLFRTQRLDDWSGWFIGLAKPELRGESFITEPFFYNGWMRKKCKERFDPSVGQFYERYWAKRDTRNAFKNTSFFNLCKALINKADPNSAREAFAAEAMSRFVAGSCYALWFALLLALVDTVVVCIFISRHLTLLPLAMALVYLLLIVRILGEFRYLRCSEVDAVFGACYANRQYLQAHFSDDPTSVSASEKRAARKRILETVWNISAERGDECPSVDLDTLVAGIRKSCTDSPFLSSLYFAGADVDHSYFLKNDAIAVGLSVLPEDAEKAGHPKRHPHQVEVVFVLQGSLRLCLGKKAGGRSRVLTRGDHHVIEKGVRHWITPHEDDRAVFVFVKTNPAEEPRIEDG